MSLTKEQQEWMKAFEDACTTLGKLSCTAPQVFEGLDAEYIEHYTCRAYESENHSEYLQCEEAWQRLNDLREEEHQ